MVDTASAAPTVLRTIITANSFDALYGGVSAKAAEPEAPEPGTNMLDNLLLAVRSSGINGLSLGMQYRLVRTDASSPSTGSSAATGRLMNSHFHFWCRLCHQVLPDEASYTLAGLTADLAGVAAVKLSHLDRRLPVITASIDGTTVDAISASVSTASADQLGHISHRRLSKFQKFCGTNQTVNCGLVITTGEVGLTALF